MDKYVYIFHHTDLDGMGVKILGMIHAMEIGLPCKTIACSYSKVNTYISDSIKTVDDVEEIIIGDISVNEEIAERLDEIYQLGIPIDGKNYIGQLSHAFHVQSGVGFRHFDIRMYYINYFKSLFRDPEAKKPVFGFSMTYYF